MVNPINPENPDSKCHETVLLYNNLPTQTNDVMVNPINPDSKPGYTENGPKSTIHKRF